MSWGVDAVTVRFGERTALDRVSLEARPGEVACVVGGDGAGKTTTLRVLAGALAPASGGIRRPAARRIGYMSAASGTYPDLSVDEQLEFVAAAYGLRSREARTRADALLERTGLAPYRGRLTGHLSGGMRQKLGIVAALLPRPDLLVLDEPTTGVDPVSRADVWSMIATAAADGAAVVVSTTYIDEAERALGLVVLDQGRTLASGSPDAVVAAVPGAVRRLEQRPSGAAVARSWRRGATWRIWDPDGAAGSAPPPDLHDAVIALALSRELAATS